MPLAHFLRVQSDRLRYSARIRQLNALWLALRSFAAPAGEKRLALLARSFGFAEDPGVERRIAKRIVLECAKQADPAFSWRSISADNPRYAKALTRDSFVNRGVLLKPPGVNGEKGVILVTFEYNWVRMLRGISDWALLESQFDIIFSNSWSPTDYALVLEVLAHLRGDMFVQTNNRGDIPRLSRLNPRIHAVPTMPSDWVHPAYYRSKPVAERAYDLVMVANWAPFKRHWEIFAALRDLPASWRILLLGQPEAGRTMSDVQALSREYGVPQEITWRERLPISAVAELQAEGRISVVLSRREGACVAVAESLLADSPVALRADAHIGAKAYINESTGLLLRPKKLAADLRLLWERAPELTPRQWAVAHASAPAAHAALNAFMRDAALRRGLPWTRDLSPHCWRPYPSLITPGLTADHAVAAAGLCSSFDRVFNEKIVTTVDPPVLAG